MTRIVGWVTMVGFVWLTWRHGSAERRRRVSELPSGTVTFLFTDLEGSTRLWEEHPDLMHDALARHDELVRAAIEGQGGSVVKTTGDGFHAAFGTAEAGVDAAVAAQLALDEEAWTLPRPLRVRMGVHTCEAELRDGDYYASGVNRAARLMSVAHGGQVVVSLATSELVRDTEIDLVDLGEHRLRDLAAAERVFQVQAPGLEREFPPLRSLDELPGNLPVQRTSFVGRADELKELTALVARERLVTLTGPGGVGKSRLALQVAAELGPAFKDGVWFASLAALEEGALTAATVLEAIGVPTRRGESATETLCAWGKTREALLVIDNCEHLPVEVAEMVDRLLEKSTTVSVVATSQSPLGVRGEHVWTVAPLSGPQGASRDSVMLFADRARMVRADFAITDENEGAIVDICEQLDHVPLAIELAAARVRAMTPADISRRLDQRLRLLASSDRLAPGRHRTLDAAARWSYDLLDETQQRVFDRLSVFAGPFTIEAAEAVVAGDGVDEWEVLDGILGLVDKSLVVADEHADHTRYRLLETLRHFGQANLATADTLVQYRERHADHYADYVLLRRPQLHGAGDLRARDEVEGELENIRVALRHAADDHSSARFEHLYEALFTVWQRNRCLEGASWGIELRGRPDSDPIPRIAALGVAAHVTQMIDLAVGAELAEAAEALAATTDGALPLAALAVSAIVDLYQGRTDAAIAGAEHVVALSGDEPDLFVRANALGVCCSICDTGGAHDRAVEIERTMMSLAETLDNRFTWAIVSVCRVSGIHMTEPDGGAEYLRRALAMNDEVGLHQSNASVAMFLALHELRRGDRSAAARTGARSLQVAIEYTPTFIAMVTNTAIAIVSRPAPGSAAELLGALRAHRARAHQEGTSVETDAEAHYEASLRRRLGDEFDPHYARGLTLDDAAMVELALTQLAVIVNSAPDA
jgi:predicted ATPase/class 3 adenylate cyclase